MKQTNGGAKTGQSVVVPEIEKSSVGTARALTPFAGRDLFLLVIEPGPPVKIHPDSATAPQKKKIQRQMPAKGQPLARRGTVLAIL
jgi:hypothetical protein